MIYAKLLKTDISSNYVWAGDRIYISAKWQCLKTGAPFSGRMRVDFEFGYQRRLENMTNDYSCMGEIFPHMYLWDTGNTYETACAYNVPSVWGGTHRVFISLLNDDNIPVPFMNGNGEEVMRQEVAVMEFCFAKPSEHLKSIVEPIEGEEAPLSLCESEECSVPVLDFGIAKSHVVALIRKIDDNTIISNYKQSDIEFLKDDGGYVMKSSYAQCKIAAADDRIILDDVSENDGYELISIYLPEIAALSNAKVMNFALGGKVADTVKNPALGFTVPFDVINAMGVYDENAGTLVFSDRLDFIFRQSIQRENGVSKGVIGVELSNRVPAKKPGMKSPAVIGEKSVYITHVKNADWQTFVTILRDRLTPLETDLYDNCIFYKYMLDHGDDEPVHSLEDVRKTYTEVANITDNMRQILYMVGWQKGGHDWYYPEPFEVNDIIGEKERIRAEIENAREYNTILSLHDNFEDAYLQWLSNPELVAKDAYGDLYKGWIWSGGMSYIVSLKRALESGLVKKRIDWILDMGIKDTYHIDVTTSEVRRYDFSEEILTAADENLEYKLKIFEEFNKHGIDVTSETVAYPFIGKTGHGWSMRLNGSKLYKNEEPAHITPMLYHGVIPCGIGAGSRNAILNGFIIGAKACWGDAVCLTEDMIKSYYLLTVPMLLFEKLKCEKYIYNGDEITVLYENNSRITVNRKKYEYEAVYNGEIIAKNWVTNAPGIKKNIRYLYAEEETEIKLDGTYMLYEMTRGGAKEIGKAEKAVLKPGVPIKAVMSD